MGFVKPGVTIFLNRIWVSFVRSGGGKTGGIASSFEDFDTPGAGEDDLKPGWIKCDFIFARALSLQKTIEEESRQCRQKR
jgi:hypothetical protein